MYYSGLFQPPPIDHYAHQTDLSFYFFMLEQLWLSPGPLPQLVSFFGMRCLHLLALEFWLVTSLPPLLFSKPFSSLWPCALGAPLNGSPYEKRFINAVSYTHLRAHETPEH